MARRRTLLIGLLGIALSVAAYAYFRVDSGVHEWRERVRVTLQTPDGPITRETTRAVRYVLNVPNAPVGSPRGFRVRGETVAFDLGDKGALVILTGNAEMNLFRALRRNDVPPSDMRMHLWRPNLTFMLPETNYPFMAYFPDKETPTSARRLTRQSLPNILGPGYGVSDIVFSRSYGFLTKGMVAEILPWLTEDTDYGAPEWRELFRKNGFLRDAVLGTYPGWKPIKN